MEYNPAEGTNEIIIESNRIESNRIEEAALMRTRILILLTIALLVPTLFAVTWPASPALAQSKAPSQQTLVVIPCTQTQGALLDLFSYSPPGPSQTYRISFTAQGRGFVRLHITPVYAWIDTQVNSVGGPTDYSYDWTIDRYPGRPTELQMEGYPASCAVYPDGLTVTNISINPIATRHRTITF